MRDTVVRAWAIVAVSLGAAACHTTPETVTVTFPNAYMPGDTCRRPVTLELAGEYWFCYSDQRSRWCGNGCDDLSWDGQTDDGLCVDLPCLNTKVGFPDWDPYMMRDPGEPER